MRSKTATLKIQILTALLLLTATLLWVVSTRTVPPPIPESIPVQEKIHEKTIANGVKIDDYARGRKTFSMQIDKLRVVKKKLGFLQLGFIKIARVEGVTLDWYEGNNKNKAEPANEDGEFGNLVNSKRFSDLLNKLKQYLPGNIKSVELFRVKMNFFQNGKFLTSIISDSAAYRGQGENKRMVFKGNVKLQNNTGKKLECEKITWLIDKKSFTSTKFFVFEDHHQKMQGKGFKSDFELNEIIAQERKRL